MEAVVLNMNNGKVSLGYLSVSLKLCYILMNKIALAGEMELNLLMGEDYCSLPVLIKIKLIKDFQASTFENKIDLDKLTLIENDFKKIIHTKHPPINSIKVLKQFENEINKLFLALQKNLNIAAAASGLVDLKELLEKDIFNIYKIDINEHILNKSTNTFLCPIAFLQLALSNHKATDTLLVLTDGFLDSVFLNKQIILDYKNSEVLSTDEIYMYRCLQFPITNGLKSIELQSIRSKFKPYVNAFNEGIKRWLSGFEDNIIIEERRSTFIEYVIPELQGIQNVIDTNDMLKFAYGEFKNTTLDVWLGEAPLSKVWEYYHHYDCLNDNIYISLINALERNPKLNKRVPVMVTAIIGEAKNKFQVFEVDKDEEIILIPRKSILINE